MNKKLLLAGLFVFIQMFFGSNNLQAQDKTYILPGTYFDKAAAEKALQPGKSAIRGTAYTRGFKDTSIIGPGRGLLGKQLSKLGPKQFATKGTTVTLFPLTPYFQEYLELRSKYKPGGKKVAVISNDAYYYRITTQVVDDKGNFQFTNLKPGKYMVETTVSYTKKGTASEQVGTETGYNVYGQQVSSTPIYSSYSVFWSQADYVSEIIDITEDESIIDVKLN